MDQAIASRARERFLEEFTVSLDSARARSASELRAAFAAAGLALSLGDAPTTPREALAWLHRRSTAHDAVLATGSHLVAAAVLRATDEPA